MSNADTLLEFPCDFPIKVMGAADARLAELVEDVVRRHLGEQGALAWNTRPSSRGRYVSVTVTVRARSKAELDAIYRELSAHESVLMAL